MFVKYRKIFAAVLLVLTAACFVSCKKNNDELVGKWMCDMYGSVQIIEFTSDGKFIDYSTSSENRYRIKDEEIEIYVEGEEDSTVSVTFSVDENTLKLGGAEYERVFAK
jgi:hypothetical protein